MTTDPVARLFAAQAGLATRAQLTTAGLSRSALAWRLGRDWRLVLPRVVAAQRGPLSDRQRLVAALLYAGPGAALTSDGTLLPRPDGWFDDVAMAVQVHSREYHDGSDEWDDTVMSDGIYPEYGIVVVGVTPHRIARSPTSVLARIERAYAAAAQRPRPSVLAAPVGHGLVAGAPR